MLFYIVQTDFPKIMPSSSKKSVFPIILQFYVQQYVVGPCHHGMARPKVADRGTVSDKEGSCE